MKDIKEIVSLCKRRGFIFRASEIYDGINGFWDYGPLGVELKNNLRDAWWKSMVTCPPVGHDGEILNILGLDSSIIQNSKTWKASGHLDGFSDSMVDCKETKLRYRADHLNVYIAKNLSNMNFAILENTPQSEVEKHIQKFAPGAKFDDYDIKPLKDINFEDYKFIMAPDASKTGTLTEPKEFNLMFKTEVGAVSSGDNITYLRPETAQGIFLNYKNILDSCRVKIPFGVAQIGKAFRNEVTPRNFIFRSREFEQMELEWFCHPDEADKWFEFWKNHRLAWWKQIGLNEDDLQMRTHEKDELAHYAKNGFGTVDIEFAFPFSAPGYGELEGIAHRCDFDLSQHQAHSNINLEYHDTDKQSKFIPHVIEPSSGLTRGVLAILCSAYTLDANRPSGAYFKFSPKIAPVKAAILPLTAKGELPELAYKIYMNLRNNFNVQIDIKQSIGKRYARQDEIGTPFCFTVDHDSLQDNAVTVRDRDTMSQIRIKIDELHNFLSTKIS